eukprot:TRINITY_DN334_c0_g1_i2.p1 TRINITY_DN334_c0_g1~~TRINITY_DN334_c0_g1_i2.p1  ORF type:complete len:232 (-),score=48.32 TRINITY_DN334_c0_g1_i2:84-779(-)
MRFLLKAVVASAVIAGLAVSCDTSTLNVPALVGQFEQCQQGCVGSADQKCVAECVVAQLKTDVECSSCVQGITSCFSSNCGTQCAPSNSTSTLWNFDCLECGYSECSSAFHACLPTPSVAPTVLPQVVAYAASTVGACQDAADSAVLTSEAAGCGLLCAFNASPTTCVETCLENDAKFSVGCRQCIANGVSCFNSKCASACPKGLTDPTCSNCIKAQCSNSWNACMATAAP